MNRFVTLLSLIATVSASGVHHGGLLASPHYGAALTHGHLAALPAVHAPAYAHAAPLVHGHGHLAAPLAHTAVQTGDYARVATVSGLAPGIPVAPVIRSVHAPLIAGHHGAVLGHHGAVVGHHGAPLVAGHHAAPLVAGHHGALLAPHGLAHGAVLGHHGAPLIAGHGHGLAHGGHLTHGGLLASLALPAPFVGLAAPHGLAHGAVLGHHGAVVGHHGAPLVAGHHGALLAPHGLAHGGHLIKK